MSPRALASQLRSFNIVPGTVWIDSTRSAKGYKREAFLNVWSRYISPVVSVNPSRPAENLGIFHISNRQEEEILTDKTRLNAALTNDPDVLTDRTPPEIGNTRLSDIQRARLASHEDDAEERAAIQDDGMDIPDFLIRPIANY